MAVCTLTRDGTFERLESEVRYYCRAWPVVFDRAEGSFVYTENDERAYLDFFAGAGALNYGHNHPVLRRALVDYVSSSRITHSLDMYTSAKRDFLEALDTLVLAPRGLEYKVMFPGPAGTTAVEAALKLARTATGRSTVVSFTNGFHGASLGALAVTGNASKRAAAGVAVGRSTTTVPYDGYLGDSDSGIEWLERALTDRGSGVDLPAAAIVETVQGEGGLNTARPSWLRALSAICRRHGILLVIDDVQMGCGRTGPFFSFEEAGIEPDIVTLSKSIGGYGMPLALTLVKPEVDSLAPGAHNGTFRGQNPSFVTGRAALEHFWSDRELEAQVLGKGARVEASLERLRADLPGVSTTVRGRGLARGLAFADADLAGRAAAEAFDRGLLVETAGVDGQVLKLLPPLTVTDAELDLGLGLLREAVTAAAHGDSRDAR